MSEQCLSLTVISNMEVPRRPHPTSLTLALPKPASSALSPLGAVEKVAKKEPMTDKLQEKKDGTTEKDQFEEETFHTEEESVVSSELKDTNTSTVETKLSSQDSFSDDSSMSEERFAEDSKEAKRKSEEEEAAAKERTAQRQLMAIEELVQSERNYLHLLQMSTVTIRSNLQKLQVSHACSVCLQTAIVFSISSIIWEISEISEKCPSGLISPK